MSSTPKLGIPTFAKTDDIATIDWMQAVNGEGDESMAGKVDQAIGALQQREVYSSEQPQNQDKGDVWHEIISITEEGGS